MKHIIASLKTLLFMTVLTGLAYPIVVTVIGHVFFRQQVSGRIVRRSGARVGSLLVEQDFTQPKYFWPRPSAAGFNPLPSGGSNLGPTSAALKQSFELQRAKLIAADPGAGVPPQDLLFASGSGLDPDISPAAARYQIARVAKARGIAQSQIDNLVKQYTQPRQFGFLGEPRVNVLALNLALDRLSKK